MSGDKTFVDTNILVYAYDTSAGTKQVEARKVISDLWNSGLGVLSTQVLQEFFVTVTRKLPKPMIASQAREIVSDFMKWEVATVDGETILDAINLQKRKNLSLWDSLIIVAAGNAGCSLLLSEDLPSGIQFGSMEIRNPFV